jgi:hypothetical protein
VPFSYFLFSFLASEKTPWWDLIDSDDDDKTEINPAKRAKTNKKNNSITLFSNLAEK